MNMAASNIARALFVDGRIMDYSRAAGVAPEAGPCAG